MLGKRFTVWRLALRNLSKQKFQTIILFVLLSITTITLFFSDFLTSSMRDGLKEAKERLGADLIVVPDRFVSGIEESLFLGKPCTVNFDKDWLDKIAKVEGVDKVSYQLYIASLGMECCDSSLQLIAFDADSDFVVAPWLSEDGIKHIAEDEIVLGSNMKKKVGDKVKYFGREFRVIDILAETGMGYDNCAFISYATAYRIANDPKYDNILPFHKNEKVISMVQVKLKVDQNANEVKDNIEKTYPDSKIAVYTTSSMVSRFAGTLSDFNIYGTIFKILFLIFTVIALYGVYSITIHLRKTEFGIFFSFGTRRRTILLMLIAEMLILVVIATVVGIGAVGLFMIPFHDAIKKAFAIPYLMPNAVGMLIICLKTFIINLLVCILACVKSFYELVHLEGIQLMKSNNE
jgi:putative ABC transport system permease protein